MARLAAIAVALLIAGVVSLLVWGAWQGEDGSAVDDLPTVSDVVAAQAHRHGIELPELTDDDRARLSAPPTAGSMLSPYDQVITQLIAVREAAGVDEAVEILGEVALQSEAVAGECRRLYLELTAGQTAARSLAQTCPG